MSRMDPQVNIRLPAALIAQLDRRAMNNHRSFRSEIVHILEATLSETDQPVPGPVGDEVMRRFDERLTWVELRLGGFERELRLVQSGAGGVGGAA